MHQTGVEARKKRIASERAQKASEEIKLRTFTFILDDHYTEHEASCAGEKKAKHQRA